MGFSQTSRLDEILGVPAARGVLAEVLPGIVNSPMAAQLSWMSLGHLVSLDPDALGDPDAVAGLWARLASIDAEGAGGAGGVDGAVVEPGPPRDDYEAADVPLASARIAHPDAVGLRGRVEIVLEGPAHGNPFVDVELTATVLRDDDSSFIVGGFYDGDGVYKLRFLAHELGEYRFVTSSNARSLDGLSGTIVCRGDAVSRGVVRVADTFHFAAEDGERYLPIGTTAYAWTHQSEALQWQTLDTLAASPFTKIRMCVFPKAYLFNQNEPAHFPFVGSRADGFDFTLFDPAWFAEFEQRIDQLAELGIEADLILFHAYDRWGFSHMSAAADDRFVSYVVRRLSAFANVWWSLANEYDLLPHKSIDDWERIAAVVGANDPSGHLISIHNCFGFYDYTRPWITHSSVQRIDVYKTSENTDAWREQWGKPVVIDECAYEGDIDQGWGNITGPEMVRRFWEGAVRGGYVGHGETYLNDRDELWWSKGGELVGSSPARIAFLTSLTAAAPGGVLNPLPSDWDVPWAGVAGEYYLLYLGFGQARYRNIVLPSGGEYAVDVIDTWNMTIDRLEGRYSGYFRVPLPARQYMAIRLTRVP